MVDDVVDDVAVKKPYLVKMKQLDYGVMAETPQDAMKQIIARIKNGEIGLENCSLIMLVRQSDKEDEDIGCRVVPALYGLGLISRRIALASLGAGGIPLSAKEFQRIVDADSWLWEGGVPK